MGCDIYLFRKDDHSETPDHGELFWDAKSWDLGFELSMHGFGDHYEIVTPDDLICLSKELINEGKDDMGEYPEGALKALVESLNDLDLDTKSNSNWFLTMSC